MMSLMTCGSSASSSQLSRPYFSIYPAARLSESFAGFGGGPVLLNLVHIESEPVELDVVGLEDLKAVDNVAAHVLPTRVMIAEVEEDDVLPVVVAAPQPAGSLPHFGL